MKRLTYIVLVLAAMLASCKDDYLETAPSTAVGEIDLLQSPEIFDSYMDGINTDIYDIYYSNVWRGVMKLNINLDYLGDDWMNTVPATYLAFYRWEANNDPTSNHSYVYWDFNYTLVERTNRVIALASKVKEASEIQINTWLAEAHAIRAYAYHNLVQLYGKRYVKGQSNDNPGVLLRLSVNFDPMPRSTVAEVYAQINDDIQKSISYYASGLDLGRKDRIRPSTAYGIASRIALTQEDWTLAAQYADSAIKLSGATLQSGKELIDGFNNKNATEWMWGYSYNAAQNPGYSGFFCYHAYNFDGYATKYAANRTLLNKMSDNDIRWKWFICYDRGDKIPSDVGEGAMGERFSGTNNGLPGWEFTAAPIKWKVPDETKSKGDQLVMRLAEMYYIKAEALAKAGDEAGAKATLVKIMETRDPDYTAAKVASLAGDDLVNEIMLHRTIDLFGEGFRFLDMKRTRTLPVRDTIAQQQAYIAYGERYKNTYMPEVEAALAKLRAQLDTTVTADTVKIQKAIAEWQADSVFLAVTIPARCQSRCQLLGSRRKAYTLPVSLDDNRWEFVIPIDEIQGNPLCTQNPL